LVEVKEPWQVAQPVRIGWVEPLIEPGDQRALGADAAGDDTRDEHRDAGEREVTREQKLDLARRGMQVLYDRRQDRVDQPQTMNDTTAANATPTPPWAARRTRR
jgi:hypothetical protein